MLSTLTKSVGVDWAGNGWVCATKDEEGWSAELYPSMLSVWRHHHDAESILVDIPIGLPATGRRSCDEAARAVLGRGRQGSVFWTPCRAAVYTQEYEAAKAENRDRTGNSISSQAWGIIPRIQEVDEFLQEIEPARGVVRESHPEVCFAKLRGGKGLSDSKTTDAGIDARLDILDEYGEVSTVYHQLVDEHIDDVPPFARRIGTNNRDDLLDAMALAITGVVGGDDLSMLPDDPPTDETGLRMEIVYATF